MIGSFEFFEVTNNKQSVHWVHSNPKMGDEDESSMVKHFGSCHCGSIQWEAMASPDVTAWDCNCSICKMKGNVYVSQWLFGRDCLLNAITITFHFDADTIQQESIYFLQTATWLFQNPVSSYYRVNHCWQRIRSIPTRQSTNSAKNAVFNHSIILEVIQMALDCNYGHSKQGQSRILNGRLLTDKIGRNRTLRVISHNFPSFRLRPGWTPSKSDWLVSVALCSQLKLGNTLKNTIFHLLVRSQNLRVQGTSFGFITNTEAKCFIMAEALLKLEQEACRNANMRQDLNKIGQVITT